MGYTIRWRKTKCGTGKRDHEKSVAVLFIFVRPTMGMA